jgi:hypothetical protein
MSNSMTLKRPFDLRVHGAPYTNTAPVKGMVRPDLKALGLILPMAGGAKGYNAAGDVLTQTADGRSLVDIWTEFQQTIAIANERRQSLIDLLTFPVTSIIEDVPQFGGGDFEIMSEYGVPQGIRPTTNVLSLGYSFQWYDLAARFTWQFLAEASTGQVEAVHQSALEADNRLVFLEVMRTLFRNTNRVANINQQNYNVYTFWNNDGTVPPAYKNNTFASSHTHFRTSGAGTINSGDLDEIVDDFKAHGYSVENGTQHFLMANNVEATIIRSFKVATGSRYDFIPSQGQPAVILPSTGGLLGSQVGNSFRGFNVIGSYGSLLIIEEDYIPAGYVAAFASGGAANLNNPIGFREHANAGLRGLRLVKGRDGDYPLIDSYYARGFGTGVRQRGAGMVMQITASGTYAIPAAYV